MKCNVLLFNALIKVTPSYLEGVTVAKTQCVNYLHFTTPAKVSTGPVRDPPYPVL